MVTVILVNIGSGNGMSPVRHKGITLTNTLSLLIWVSTQYKFIDKMQRIFCKRAAILLRLRCFKSKLISCHRYYHTIKLILSFFALRSKGIYYLFCHLFMGSKKLKKSTQYVPHENDISNRNHLKWNNKDSIFPFRWLSGCFGANRS